MAISCLKLFKMKVYTTILVFATLIVYCSSTLRFVQVFGNVMKTGLKHFGSVPVKSHGLPLKPSQVLITFPQVMSSGNGSFNRIIIHLIYLILFIQFKLF